MCLLRYVSIVWILTIRVINGYEICYWTGWRECTAQCGGSGTENRVFKCCDTSIGVCTDDNTQNRRCSKDYGNWGFWDGWTQCSVTCGQGQHTRQRVCDNPPASSGCGCIGSDTGYKMCNIESIHGGWGPWSQYGSCSKTCDSGTHTRRRICNQPSPAYCGNSCVGNSQQTTHCNTQGCPVNGNWSPWGSWSQCSVTCGQGTRQQSRPCNNPAPQNGGAYCTGSNTLTEQCTIPPVHGGWEEWSSYSSCSTTCGNGTRIRRRDCNNPPPAKCGSDCLGISTESTYCNIKECPVDGNWGLWEHWSKCSVTCGQGTKQRRRECDNPTAQHGGNICPGSDTEHMYCNTPPVHGGWGSWSQYTTCSKTCGSGTTTRTRTCNAPIPVNCGNECPGSSIETNYCNIQHCTETTTFKLSTPPTVYDLPTSTSETYVSSTQRAANTTTATTVRVADATAPTTKHTSSKHTETITYTTNIKTDSHIAISLSTLKMPSESRDDPNVTGMFPDYGPQVGGTIITVHGYNLPVDGVLRIGDSLYCETTFANDTHMLTVTPLLGQIDAIEQTQKIHIIIDSARVLETSYEFVYKGNPTIDTVYPTQTITQGGTKITVLGSNLNSVAVISMETTMVLKELQHTQPPGYNVSATTYATVCSIINGTQMLCPTPTIDLPHGFSIDSRLRNRRSILKHTNMLIKSFVKSRARRDVKIQFSNDGDVLEFYIGFNMDGVDNYQNYTIIDVYIEPEFTLNIGVQTYTLGRRLEFQGEHLDVGVSVYDYNITIGKERCRELKLLSNMLSCLPPDDKPDIEDDSEMGHPMIMINVGLNIQHMAGYLRYPEDTLPLYVIILASVIPICAVVIIVTAVVCVKKRR